MNYAKTNIDNADRAELHEKLALTGAEVSINHLPAGASVPFVHAHRNNEEIYGILSGRGRALLDGETIELVAGDWVRIDPCVKRQIFADQAEGLSYICIQVKANSLDGYTVTDAIIC